MENTSIGCRIKHARELRNVTLDDIAVKVGVAKSTIQRYENDKIEKHKLPVLHSIAEALNVNPAWVVGKSDHMDIQKVKAPKILDFYNSLNDLGKYEATKRVEELTYIPQYSMDYVDAAHIRTDIDVTEEMMQHDDDIMDDENF